MTAPARLITVLAVTLLAGCASTTEQQSGPTTTEAAPTTTTEVAPPAIEEIARVYGESVSDVEALSDALRLDWEGDARWAEDTLALVVESFQNMGLTVADATEMTRVQGRRSVIALAEESADFRSQMEENMQRDTSPLPGN